MYKCSIHILRPFKYNNTCELCDNILDKYKKGILMVNRCSVLHEEDIDVFHEKYYIPTIENLPFYLAHVSILGSMECGKTRNDFSTLMDKVFYIKLKDIMQKNSAKQPVYKYTVNIGWKYTMINGRYCC